MVSMGFSCFGSNGFWTTTGCCGFYRDIRGSFAFVFDRGMAKTRRKTDWYA